MMKDRARWLLLGLGGVLVLSFLGLGAGTISAFAGTAAPTPAAPGDRRAYDPQTGRLTYVGFDPRHGPVVGGAMSGRRSMAAQGETLLAPYAAAFGIRDQDNQLRVESAGENSVHYQQLADGIPVVGGEVVVSVSDDGGLESINGEISPDPQVADAPEVSASEAAVRARQGVAARGRSE